MWIDHLIDTIKLPFRKEKELYSSLRNIIGFYPRNISYYKQALLHKSMAMRNERGRLVNNERLEFLGDAVLDAVVGDIVYRHFEGKREGFLTNTRSKIVQRDTLNRLAQEMGIIGLIQSNGHISSHNSYMGGNAFEALVGAIYLDRGYNACMRFMEKRILCELINIDKVAYKEVNFKSKLLEWAQKNRVVMDFKEVEQKMDEKGSPMFTYRVILESVKGETGAGYTKKEAQQQAAKLTLQRLRKEPQFIDAVFAAKADRTKAEKTATSVASEPKEPKESKDVKPREAQKPQEENPKEVKAKELKPKEPKPKRSPRPKEEKPKEPRQPQQQDEFDLSDIRGIPSTREDIIAAAEAAAFAAADEA